MSTTQFQPLGAASGAASSLQEAVSRLFDASFVRPFGAVPGFDIALDIEAYPDEYIICANVPGLRAEDLHVEVEANTVTLWGEVKPRPGGRPAQYLLLERPSGPFRRSLTLPAPLNPARARATVENGVLTLRLPKAEAARPQTIRVKVKG